MGELNVNIGAVSAAAATFGRTADSLTTSAGLIDGIFAAGHAGEHYAPDQGRKLEAGFANVAAALRDWATASNHCATALGHNADSFAAEDDVNAVKFGANGGLTADGTS